MSPRTVTTAYRAGAWLACHLPGPVVFGLAALGSRLASRVARSRALVARRNLERALGRPLGDDEARRMVGDLFASYGRYWADSFRLPSLRPEEVEARFDLDGYEHVVRARQAGKGIIFVLPHLGGWEWAAYWLTQVEGFALTVVVEDIEPPELRDFFVDFRRGLGMEIVVLGPHAGAAVTGALARGDMVCLLADRDIDGTGIPVEFFGEETTLPAGPAALALRTGAALIPGTVYFDGPRHRAVLRPCVPVERRDGFRKDVARITQALAHELEALIVAAPTQWHLLQPNWASDHEALAAAGFPTDEATA